MIVPTVIGNWGRTRNLADDFERRAEIQKASDEVYAALREVKRLVEEQETAPVESGNQQMAPETLSGQFRKKLELMRTSFQKMVDELNRQEEHRKKVFKTEQQAYGEYLKSKDVGNH